MTYDQHIASDPSLSVWVSASAGTGKTKVLTDRVLRLLLAGSEPSKILCITYTKAAAAEMEHRIEEQLGRWAIEEESKLHNALMELTGREPDERTLRRARKLFALVLDAPQRIRIQTIHGFCQSVLQRFPLEAEVPSHFTLIDNHTSAELFREARARLFSESGADNLAPAIEYFAGAISETMLNELISGIIDDRMKFIPWFEESSGASLLVRHVYEKSGLTAGVTEQELFHKYFQYAPEALHSLKAACAALAEGKGKIDQQMANAIHIWLTSNKDLNVCKAYCEAFLTDDGGPRKKLFTKDTGKYFTSLADVLLAEQGRVVAYANEISSLQVVKATAHLIKLAEAFLGIYRKLKDEHGYMDFDDLIMKTVNLLKRKSAAAWVLYKLDGGIDHLLVDEAQDTSPEQWVLVDMLTTEFFAGEGARQVGRTLFVVGDSKQSIYSFQGAQPAAFADMQSHLRKRISASGAKFQNVRLGLSFRSTEPVLRAVDDVFSVEAVRDGLIFDESDISHSAHRRGMAGRVEVWPLMENAEPEGLLPWQIPEKQFSMQKAETMLAGTIALQIKQWLSGKRTIPSQDRPVQAGDIMILVQRRSLFASAMLRALKRHDIPVAGADRLILTEHIAIADCIALASFLLLPQDDLTLAVVLKSPFLGLSEEDLFELAYDRKEKSLWQRLKENSRFQTAHDYLASLLARVDYLPPYELFAHILDTLGGRKKLAERLGSEIDDPLNEFLSLALEYDRLHVPALQGFLHWLESGTSEIKRDMEKGSNEVRIMTVHGAKGLQAPIVFLPDTTRLPRSETGILWTGGAEEIPLWSPVTGADSNSRNVKERLQLEREREYRRLLYVAMTRAEDELYICGWKGSKAVSDKCWYQLVKQGITDKWQEIDGKWVLVSEQTEPPKTKTVAVRQDLQVELPGWVYIPPSNEQGNLKPLTPSRIENPSVAGSPVKDQKARMRGTLIHRLLQYLPDVEPARREEITRRFMDAYAQNFTGEEREQIQKELFGIFGHTEFAPLFSADSVAEAPVSGIVTDAEGNKTVISGQIDRISVMDKEVYIIDYKTGVQVPETQAQIPKVYVRQMAAYRELVSRIYPDKTVHCALLWTSEPKLMKLEF